MNRIDEIKKYVTKDLLSIEISPYHNPILKKSEGYNVFTLDIFDKKALVELAKNDPNISSDCVEQIEEVDIVTSATEIQSAIEAKNYQGKVNTIISSHNFEHLPNPIKFLKGCYVGLGEGGVLSMAIPDYRACFDHYRFPTRLSDWIMAYQDDLKSPSPSIIFDFRLNNSYYEMPDLSRTVGCDISTGNSNSFIPTGNIYDLYPQFLNSLKKSDYEDAHVSVLTPKILNLHLLDLINIGLIDYEIIEISKTVGLEFYVHLRKIKRPEKKFNKEEYFYQRHSLLREINKELGSAVYRK